MTGTVQLLIFRLDDRLYGVRIAQIDRVIRAVDAVPLPNAPDIVLGAINFRGEVIAVLDTGKRFGIPGRAISVDDEFIIAASSKRTVAMRVDSVTEVVERSAGDIVPSGKILPQLNIEGVVQLDDGLALIHDLDRFLSLDEEHELDRALARQS